MSSRKLLFRIIRDAHSSVSLRKRVLIFRKNKRNISRNSRADDESLMKSYRDRRKLYTYICLIQGIPRRYSRLARPIAFISIGLFTYYVLKNIDIISTILLMKLNKFLRCTFFFLPTLIFNRFGFLRWKPSLTSVKIYGPIFKKWSFSKTIFCLGIYRVESIARLVWPDEENKKRHKT